MVVEHEIHDDMTSNSVNKEIIELMQVFPLISRTEICEALHKCNNNLEEACELLLSDSTTSTDEQHNHQTVNRDIYKSVAPIDELISMFPNVNKQRIKDVYNSNKKSMDPTISELLNFEILSAEESGEQKLLEGQIIQNKSSVTHRKNDWKENSDRAKIIQQYTSVDSETAMKAYYESCLSVPRAIIKIIRMDNNDVVDKKVTNTPLEQLKPVIGGKVQSTKGFAHTKTKPAASNNVSTYNQYNPPALQMSHTYNPDSSEVSAISELLNENGLFKFISSSFTKKALAFYKGDVARTISLANFIIESNASKFTYSQSTPSNSSTDNGFITTQSLKKVKSKNYRNNGRILKPKDFQNEEYYEKGSAMIENILVIPRLDFHGFLPKDAILVLDGCLRKWWNKEIMERELNAKTLKTFNTSFVAPLEVITGRGIHSVGGVSVLKKKVKKFLEDQNYIFWEEPSYFTVTGKRPPKGFGLA